MNQSMISCSEYAFTKSKKLLKNVKSKPKLPECTSTVNTMAYSYYDYLLNYYHEYYDNYYDNYYWPRYYGIFNISDDSWCDPTTTTTNPPSHSNATNTSVLLQSTIPCTPRYDGTFPPNPFPYQKWWYDGVDTIGIVFTTLDVIWSLMAILIVAIFFYKLRKSTKTKGQTRPDTMTIFLSTSCLLSHLVYNTIALPYNYYYFFAFDDVMVNRMDMVWETFWVLSKIFIYSLYAYRYYKLHRASLYSHDTTAKAMKIRFALIGLCIFVQIALEIMYGIFYFDSSTTGYEDPRYAAKQRMYLNAAWCVMAIDFVLVSLLGYLIMGTILQLAVAMNDPLNQTMARNTAEPTQTGDTEMAPSMLGTQTETQQPKMPDKTTLEVKLRSQSEDRSKTKRSSRQNNLIEITTRIALCCMISLISSLFIQFVWIIMEETENWGLLFFSYWWGLDAMVNMLCVYFSMAFAKEHYMKVCGDCLKCHKCCLWCVVKLASYKADQKRAKEVELEAAQRKDDGGYESPEVPPDSADKMDPNVQGETDFTNETVQ
eukprot:623301_1